MILTPYEAEVLGLSLQVSLLALLFSIGPGIFLAYILARCSFRGKDLLSSLIHFPLVVPPVVVGYLLLLLFGRRGILGELLFAASGYSFAFRWEGAALAAAVMGFPLLVRSARTAFELGDVKLEEAASALGASPLRVFYSITVPLALPGIFAGLILSFGRSLGEFGATITFVSNMPGRTNTIPLAIYTNLQIPGSEQQVIRLVVISLLLSIVSILASELLQKRLLKKRRQGLGSQRGGG